MRKIILWIFIFSLIFIFSPEILALEVGGEFEVLMTGIWQENGSFDSEINESLELELFLPRFADNEIQYAFRITRPLQSLFEGEELSYFAKKLYLRHRAENFNLTIGRQPVSWSFGSLLNPVDYTPGSVVMDDETNSKYTDALEVYIPFNWNSGLSIVSSFPQGFTTDLDQMKWGLRSRMGVQGYDLTLNYVQEPEHGYIAIIPERRVGLTLKGDLGDAGIYAALGHYFAEGAASSNSYLLGVDYSYNIDYYSKLTMQLEYLGLDNSNLVSLLGPYSIINNGNKGINLLSGSLAYPIDDFSSFSLTTVANLDGSNLIIAPGYQNTLPGNIDLDVNFLYFMGEENRSSSLVLGFNYPF